MYTLLKFLHLAAAIVWLGGMAFVLLALRPSLTSLLPPVQRLPVLALVLKRFFVMVWTAIAILLLTGGHQLATIGMKNAPLGWHLMLGIGILMCLIFAHIYFAPFRRLQAAVHGSNWPAGGQSAQQIGKLVMLNFALGWLAVLSVMFLK